PLTLVLPLGIKCDHAVDAAVSIPAVGGGDYCRAAGDFITVDDVHGVQVLHERAARGAARHEIHRPSRCIDHRGAYDPDIAAEILVGATTCPRHVGVARRPHARRGNASLPVRFSVVSVIGIQRVVDGGDVDDVTVAAAHGDVANDQRL